MKCFLNANVYTVDSTLPRAEAVVAKGNRIVYVGTSAGARTFYGSSA